MATQVDTLVQLRRARAPRRDAVLAAIAAALPDIASRARATEEARQVPAENIAALRASGLYSLLQPADFGGAEQDFSVLAEAIQLIGTACASTAWVCGLQAAHQWLLAQFPIAAQHDVWDAEPDGMICGSYAPVAKARPVEGGYRISGRWSFASGCDSARWGLCAALVPSAGEAPPTPHFMLVEAGDWTIDDDWHTAGLAGTGSKTLVIEDALVPAHRMLAMPDAMNGRSPGAAHHAGNPTFRMPMFCYFPSCLISAGLGAAQGALDAFIQEVGQRATRGAVAGGAIRMAEFPTIQIRVTEAAAAIDAAREILMRDLGRRTEAVRAGQAISKEDRLDSRRGQAFAVKLAVQAVEALNASTGGQGLSLANPVQRAWRDVNALSRHISFNWDAVGSMWGQFALGSEPKGMF